MSNNSYNLKKLWENYLYTMTISVETPNGLTELQPVQINSAYIEKDFDNSFLPIFLVNLNLQKDLYYDIINNHTTSKFIIQIDKYIDPGNTGKAKTKRVYIRDKFIPIINDKTPFTDEKFYKTIKYNGSNRVGNQLIPYDLMQSYDFVLVRESDLLATKKTLNTVFSSTNIITALTTVLSNAGVKNVLLSKLDNSTTYRELLTLPVPLIPQLKYIDSYYGLYKEGSQIFFDMDRAYILRNSPQCTAWSQNEFKEVAITINMPSSGQDLMVGSVVDNEQRSIFLNTNKDQVSFIDKTTSSDMTIGNKTMLVNTVSGGITNVTPNVSTIGSTTSNIRTTSTRNEYANSELQMRQSEFRNIVNIICNGIDISHITPNKKYKLLSNIPSIIGKIKGDYRLCKAIYHFAKEGDHFAVMTNLELRRPN